MEAFGPASESLRLSERYRSLTDDELLAIADDTSDLTELAQQALVSEISQRKLNLPAKVSMPAPYLEPREADCDGPYTRDPYEEDRKLVQIATVWSLRDAAQLQMLLDHAGIPFFVGDEKTTRAEDVTSNFRDGVPVAVMQIGLASAQQALEHYEPSDEPPTQDQSSAEDLAVHCPKCHSEDVIFEHLAGSASSQDGQKFDWTCASCGHQWEDDGVETKNRQTSHSAPYQ
jgi:DNA-directed RNA polymerase subunit M/transcription elongation factor TFIIS